MPKRSYSGAGSYRYGFNGKENDNDVKGLGNQQDYGMRIYDPRLGRFLSVDPVQNEFPWNTTYGFAENDPINFIDLDGLERGTPPNPGGGRGRSAGSPFGIGNGRETARSAGVFLREGIRQARNREHSEHLRQMNTNPTYARNSRTVNSILNNFSIRRYFNNAFESASTVFGSNVRVNFERGGRFDDLVYTSMLNSGNYVGVARQISLKITGMVNGKQLVANIRVDNVGIIKDQLGNVSFDLVEAKFSINNITIGNITQTLTPQQTTAANILINGSSIQLFVRGEGSAAKLTNESNGNFFNNKQEITGQVSEITVAAPRQNTTTQNLPAESTNTNTSQTKPKN